MKSKQESAREWYQRNKEKIREKTRERYHQQRRAFVGPPKPRWTWSKYQPRLKPQISSLDEIGRLLVQFAVQKWPQ